MIKLNNVHKKILPFFQNNVGWKFLILFFILLHLLVVADEPFAAQLSQMKLFKYFQNVLRSHYSWWIINLKRNDLSLERFVASGNVKRWKFSILSFCQNLGKLINFLLFMISFFPSSCCLTFLFLLYLIFLACVCVCVSDVEKEKQSTVSKKKFFCLENFADCEMEGENWPPTIMHDTTAWNPKQMSSLFSYLSL